MRAPVRVLEGRGVIVVVIVVLGKVDMRRRQHRRKHHRHDQQRRASGPAGPGNNHAGILSGEVNKVSLGWNDGVRRDTDVLLLLVEARQGCLHHVVTDRSGRERGLGIVRSATPVESEVFLKKRSGSEDAAGNRSRAFAGRPVPGNLQAPCSGHAEIA